MTDAPAPRPYSHDQARGALHALGRRLNEAAAQGAPTDALDALLGSMRQVHELITACLAQDLCLTPHTRPLPTPIRARRHPRAA
ncbi:hypothetical protein ACFZB9_14935 [Kitasatospora sp. NPDC008050]|uniref:hypothetical protein n=1 Tax=Kitasatospora sp. NPDC008050 TaxID=3364021 RepID=UPI0036EF4A4A